MSTTELNITNGAESTPPPAPRRIRTWDPKDSVLALWCAGVAVAFTAALFSLTPLSGPLGFVLVAYGVFAAVFFVASRTMHGRLLAADRFATVLIATSATLVVVPLVVIIVYVSVQGASRMLNLSFFTDTLDGIGPIELAEGTAGGAWHSILGTLQQVLIASVISVPLGILTAVYLNEVGGRMAKTIRFLVESMSGVPSIVAGLFIYSFWVQPTGGLGFGFSGFAAALALSVLMLPTVTRTAEEMLKLVPGSLREASLALGAPEYRTVTRIVLPTARVGLVTAVILGVARVAGETAPLLLTAFGVDTLNANPFSEPQSALPLFVFKLIKAPEAAQQELAWAGAFCLILLVLVLFTIARVVSSFGKKA